MVSNVLRWVIAASLVVGCSSNKASPTAKPAENSPPPDNIEAAIDLPETSDLDPLAEQSGPPTQQDGHIRVGVFNLSWAHDSLENDSPLRRRYGAKTQEDWEWKAQAIGMVLKDLDLDIVALTEVGGEREVSDITAVIRESGGTAYDFAFVEANDWYTGHNVAILSRWDVDNERVAKIKLRQHLLTDIELPSGQIITVAAAQLRAGQWGAAERARISQARAFKRRLVKSEHPLVILATTESNYAPDQRKYTRSAAAALSGASTKSADDDCIDSGKLVEETTVDGRLADHIMACGIELHSAGVLGPSRIVRDAVDPKGDAWSAIPPEQAPYRDVSNHFVLWGDISISSQVAESEGGMRDSHSAP